MGTTKAARASPSGARESPGRLCRCDQERAHRNRAPRSDRSRKDARGRRSSLEARLSARAVGARRDHPATSPKLLVRRPLNPPVPRTLSRADCTTLGVKGLSSWPCEPKTAKGGRGATE
ncbi:unnamed protein product, partial [Ixodes pacificus]